MRTLVSIAFAFIFTFAGAQTYNKKLAQKLGADEHGMKQYVLAILKTGTYTPKNKQESDSLFAGHMQNIGRLVAEKKLFVAGPLAKNDKNYRGIFIFDVKTTEEARQLTITDPAVNAGLFDVEYFVWYGGAALPVYLETQNKITKSSLIKK